MSVKILNLYCTLEEKTLNLCHEKFGSRFPNSIVCRDVNSMNITELSSKPISKSFFILCLKEAQALFALRERKKEGGSAFSH